MLAAVSPGGRGCDWIRKYEQDPATRSRVSRYAARVPPKPQLTTLISDIALQMLFLLLLWALRALNKFKILRACIASSLFSASLSVQKTSFSTSLKLFDRTSNWFHIQSRHSIHFRHLFSTQIDSSDGLLRAIQTAIRHTTASCGSSSRHAPTKSLFFWIGE